MHIQNTYYPPLIKKSGQCLEKPDQKRRLFTNSKSKLIKKWCWIFAFSIRGRYTSCNIYLFLWQLIKFSEVKLVHREIFIAYILYMKSRKVTKLCSYIESDALFSTIPIKIGLDVQNLCAALRVGGIWLVIKSHLK